MVRLIEESAAWEKSKKSWMDLVKTLKVIIAYFREEGT